MTAINRLILARGVKWDAFDAMISHESTAYGRKLHWYTNHPELESLIQNRLIQRWESLEVPYAGPRICAAAYVYPAEFLPDTHTLLTRDHGFIDVVHPYTGYQLIQSDRFGTCTWSRRKAIAVLPESADLESMVDELVNHVWSAALIWHPPLYGLHAAGVADENGKAFLFAGDSGLGKSSLAAGLAILHGFSYLTDDLLLIDGRTLMIYGRPWQLELRHDMTSLMDKTAGDFIQHPSRKKSIINAGQYLKITNCASPRAIFILQRGNTDSIIKLRAEELRERLGEPVCLFRGAPKPIEGHEAVFDSLARTVTGYLLTLNHERGVLTSLEYLVEFIRSLDNTRL